MDVRKKTLITTVLVVAVVGIVVLQSQNKSLFQGKLFGNEDLEEANTETEEAVEEDALSDLSIDLKIIAPETLGGDLSVDVTITNEGPGAIDGKTPFKYGVYLNDVEVFTNVDSYTTMQAGDSFNFIYPISRAIYQYPDSGTASAIVDMDNDVKEVNEDNNEKEVEYF